MNKQKRLCGFAFVLALSLFTSNCASSATLLDTPIPNDETPTLEITNVTETQITATPIFTSTPIPPTNTAIPSVNLLCTENFIADSPWQLEATSDAAEEAYDFEDQDILKDKDILRVTYNLNGLMAQDGERMNDSAIVFNQPNWYGISLANPKYGQNGLDGEQTVDISLRDFVELPNPDEGIEGGKPLDLNAPVSSIRARFWHANHFIVDITSIQVCSLQP